MNESAIETAIVSVNLSDVSDSEISGPIPGPSNDHVKPVSDNKITRPISGPTKLIRHEEEVPLSTFIGSALEIDTKRTEFKNILWRKKHIQLGKKTNIQEKRRVTRSFL